MVAKSEDLRAVARRLYLDQGLSKSAIARQLGVSQPCITKWSKQEGWPPYVPPIRPKDRKKKPVGVALDQGDKAQAPRADEVPPPPIPDAPAPAAPGAPPAAPPTEIVGLSGRMDLAAYRAATLEQKAMMVLDYTLLELLTRQSSANLAKCADISSTILKGLKAVEAAQAPVEAKDPGKVAVESRLLDLEGASRPPMGDHDQGETPAPSKEDAG